MFNLIKKRGLLPKVKWKVIIDSSKYGIKKPEKEIYILAEKEAKTSVGEILFIDNKEENLTIPKERGWQTFLYDSADYEKSNIELEFFLANKVEFL